MRKRLHIMLALLLCLPEMLMAQYYSINIDLKTAAAMEAAYATGAAAEAYYYEQVKDILRHYTDAETASAAIFSSEYLKRRALTELGIWENATENYYYRRIYSLVSARIMPKVWTVARMMVRHPGSAIYWSSYLMKVCDETKALCMQFESVVTNSKLSFGDIAFLQIRSDIAEALRLTGIGGIDFEALLDGFAKAGDGLTKENLKSDLDNLYQRGAAMAASAAGELLQTSSFRDLMQGDITAAADIAENYAALFRSFRNDAGGTLLSLIGGQESLQNLFEIGGYDIGAWADDYARELAGQYYRQRWSIVRKDAGEELLCNYSPRAGSNAINSGGEWIRYSTTNDAYTPTVAQNEHILANSESYAGWSRARVQQLNAAGDGSTYVFTGERQSRAILIGGKVKKMAFAYKITVTRTWNRTETAYEEVFDSYSMDEDGFMARMNAMLASYNENDEDGGGYVLECGEKNWYQTADPIRVAGMEAATISVTCSGGATLGEGSTQYKCSSCGSSLSAHTKECSMKTSVQGGGTDTSELESMRRDLESRISGLESDIEALQKQSSDLLKLISQSDITEAARLRTEYNTLRDRIEKLQSELSSLRGELSDVEQAISEAVTGEDVPTDDYYRIPAIMSSLQSSYGLSWQGAGTWSGYTYTRTATMSSLRGTVTFTARLSIARKPKYFLGIKIHRAIVQISWELTTEYSDTHVAAVVKLDPGMSDKEKADLVNSRIAEVARQYPDCRISTEYMKSESVDEDETQDTYHLLWSSDRLAIAREVDARLTEIYSSLVSMEKMMTYRHDIIDYLKDIARGMDTDSGRRLTILEECQRRWKDSARGGRQ